MLLRMSVLLREGDDECGRSFMLFINISRAFRRSCIAFQAFISFRITAASGITAQADE